jgi:hypothetical protein
MQKGTKNITIMGLLANCSTDDARQLLKKYNYPNARNKSELEVQLAKLYKEADDKKQVEKDFAEIHPHKNFLKRYLTNDIPKPSIEVVAEKIVETPLTTSEEITSNCNGDTTCSCCKSSFDGSEKTNSHKLSENDKLIILGMFGIVSILALVIVSQKNK